MQWWKWLGIVLVLWSFLGGLLMPLRSGIQLTRPSQGDAGKILVLNVQGYNTHYSSMEKEMRAWLKLDDTHSIPALHFQIVNETDCMIRFAIPDTLPGENRYIDATLLIDNPKDGAHVKPVAVILDRGEGMQPIPSVASLQTSLQGLHGSGGVRIPYRNILEETIRNVYYHVPLWFGMVFLLIGSVVYSVIYLMKGKREFDLKASSLVLVGIVYGILGLVTGAIWARYTWGKFWSWDIKQNMAAIAVMIYVAYLLLRQSIEDPERKARISAAYAIFAFVAFIPLIFILPRMQDSLHPGAGGNPALGSDDLDNTMRMVFYPAVIGWALIGWWIAELTYRIRRQEVY